MIKTCYIVMKIDWVTFKIDYCLILINCALPKFCKQAFSCTFHKRAKKLSAPIVECSVHQLLSAVCTNCWGHKSWLTGPDPGFDWRFLQSQDPTLSGPWQVSATRPSPVKALFSQEELEIAGLSLSQFLMAELFHPGKSNLLIPPYFQISLFSKSCVTLPSHREHNYILILSRSSHYITISWFV